MVAGGIGLSVHEDNGSLATGRLSLTGRELGRIRFTLTRNLNLTRSVLRSTLLCRLFCVTTVPFPLLDPIRDTST